MNVPNVDSPAIVHAATGQQGPVSGMSDRQWREVYAASLEQRAERTWQALCDGEWFARANGFDHHPDFVAAHATAPRIYAGFHDLVHDIRAGVAASELATRSQALRANLEGYAELYGRAQRSA